MTARIDLVDVRSTKEVVRPFSYLTGVVITMDGASVSVVV